MSIAYKRLELLEFFDNERIIDNEAESVEYSLSLDGFLFKLYLAAYDEFSSATLLYGKWDNPIYNIGLNKIIKVEIVQFKPGISSLKFYRENLSDPVLSIMFKPTISFQVSL